MTKYKKTEKASNVEVIAFTDDIINSKYTKHIQTSTNNIHIIERWSQEYKLQFNTKIIMYHVL